MSDTPAILAPIEIVPTIPPAPYVIADSKFLATLAEFEQRFAALKITDGASNQLAADMQVRITKAGKELDVKRLELLRPALDWQTLINDTAKPVKARIDALKTKLSDAQVAYRDQQAVLAEKKRLADAAELVRLQKIQADEEAAAKKKADEVAAATAKAEQDRLAKLTADEKAMADELAFLDEPLPPAPVVVPEKTETQRQIEAIQHAPKVMVAAPKGVAFRETLRIDTVNVDRLPDMFVIKTADLQKIRAAYCASWATGQPLPVCDGVVFKIDRTTASTGKSGF